MSLKTEVEELLDWLLELKTAAEPGSDSGSVQVTKKDWHNLGNNLKRVAALFGNAAEVLSGLGSRPGAAVAAELARSLERESEDLQRRATILGRRADAPEPADPKARRKEIQETIAKPALGEPERKELMAELHEIDASELPEKQRQSAGAEDAERALKQASDTLETAFDKVDGKHGPVAASFRDELEVVIELTMSLRGRCAELRRSA